MKKAFWTSFRRLALLLFVPFHLSLAGGAEAGNGGGIAEKNILYAYLNLSSYLDLCLRTPLCRLSDEEAGWVRKIRADLSKEQGTPRQIEFRSEKRSPGFFRIDGQIKVAKTGSRVGSRIYINSDLLYSRLGNGRLEAVDVPMSISILVHELGHHHGVKDHRKLDLLGSRLQGFYLTRSQRAEFWNGQVALHTFQFNVVTTDEDKKNLKFLDQVVLSYRDGITDLTPSILAAIHCPAREAGQKVIGLRLYNLHEERGVTWDPEARLIRKPLQAWYILSCRPGEESDHGNIEFVLSFRKPLQEGDPEFLPEQTRITQVSCASDPTVCK